MRSSHIPIHYQPVTSEAASYLASLGEGGGGGDRKHRCFVISLSFRSYMYSSFIYLTDVKLWESIILSLATDTWITLHSSYIITNQLTAVEVHTVLALELLNEINV